MSRSLNGALAVAAFAMTVAIPAAKAAPLDVYSATFQGVTFTFTQVDANTLTLELAGTPAGDWSTANFLGAFDLKDLGINFSSNTAIANGPGVVNLLGLNKQLSASSIDCLSAGSPPGSICFDINPDFALGPLPFDLTYTIDFSTSLNIATTGPHLQIAFTNTQNGPKVGSLYSENVPLSSSGSSSGSSGSSSGSSGTIAEPNSSVLSLLGVLMLAAAMWMRRRSSNG